MKKNCQEKTPQKIKTKMHTTGTCNMYLINLKVVVTLTRVQFATIKFLQGHNVLKKYKVLFITNNIKISCIHVYYPVILH